MFTDLIPEIQDSARELVRAAGAAGLQPRVTSTLRTRSQQTRLYRRWQAGLSPLPAAPPGQSAHEFGFAFDMVVTPYSALADVGDYWMSMGGVWHESDPVHFEYPGFVVPPLESLPAQDAFSLANLLSIFYPLKAVDPSSVYKEGFQKHVQQQADDFLKSQGL